LPLFLHFPTDDCHFGFFILFLKKSTACLLASFFPPYLTRKRHEKEKWPRKGKDRVPDLHAPKAVKQRSLW
jgi:hypothetical protein